MVETILPNRFYFPPAGNSIRNQAICEPKDAGLNPDVISELNTYSVDNPLKGHAQRWALWRHGYLVYVEGDFNLAVDVASLRKTWHAIAVGAALKQGRIHSLDQKISSWEKELTGYHAEATLWHVLTQSSGFDYPYGNFPSYKPGEMWTYSDLNLVHLCNAIAKIYGKRDFWDDYQDVLRLAYFDAIGIEGWSTRIIFDPNSNMFDGVRLVLSLENMGRLGLFVLARGAWNGKQLLPVGFVEQLETKQTYGMKVNYYGPNDGLVQLDRLGYFPEVPYGFLTWVNTDGDYFPGADTAWAWGAGAGGNMILWNSSLGLVLAVQGIISNPNTHSLPQILERSIQGPNQMLIG